MRKKIMYIHGFGSSGESSSAVILAKELPECDVVAPDLPMDPRKALVILKDVIDNEKVELVVGTSMGGMLAQTLDDVIKIMVNPAFNVSGLLKTNFGRYEYLNPRKDGIQEFEIDMNMYNRFHDFEKTQFDGITPERVNNTYAFFGDSDTTVDCKDEYMRYYRNMEMFHGEHRLNQEVISSTIVPLIKRLLRL